VGKNVSRIGAMSVNEILTSVNLIGGTDAINLADIEAILELIED
jgi:hypothetical protein